MKKKGVGQNKNFGKYFTAQRPRRLRLKSTNPYLLLGPIQKVSVPDFHHINHVFEQM